jgi:type II secretory ATPase GspE/PulE/Tfp pilus assembly ATPase PilB-like protein
MHIHKNLLEIEKLSQLLQKLLENNPYFDPHHVTSKLNNQKNSHISQLHQIQPILKPFKDVFHPHISMMKFDNEQQHILDSVIENPHNLHIFTSTFSSGKTFFIKYITQHF